MALILILAPHRGLPKNSGSNGRHIVVEVRSCLRLASLKQGDRMHKADEHLFDRMP